MLNASGLAQDWTDNLLINKPNIRKIYSCVIAISDCWKLVVTILRTSFKKLPRVIYMSFDKIFFCMAWTGD